MHDFKGFIEADTYGSYIAPDRVRWSAARTSIRHCRKLRTILLCSGSPTAIVRLENCGEASDRPLPMKLPSVLDKLN